jgi:hypothetical protein
MDETTTIFYYTKEVDLIKLHNSGCRLDQIIIAPNVEIPATEYTIIHMYNDYTVETEIDVIIHDLEESLKLDYITRKDYNTQKITKGHFNKTIQFATKITNKTIFNLLQGNKVQVQLGLNLYKNTLLQ